MNNYVVFKLYIGYKNTSSSMYYAQGYDTEKQRLWPPLASYGKVLLQGGWGRQESGRARGDLSSNLFQLPLYHSLPGHPRNHTSLQAQMTTMTEARDEWRQPPHGPLPLLSVYMAAAVS